MALKCVVVTPETTVLETPADFVAFPAVDGEIGILPRRQPLVARLGYGELRVTTNGAVVHRLFVSGGFAQVRGDTVTLMTTVAAAASDIDAAAVEKQLTAVQNEPATSMRAVAERTRRINGLRAQLQYAARK